MEKAPAGFRDHILAVLAIIALVIIGYVRYSASLNIFIFAVSKNWVFLLEGSVGTVALLLIEKFLVKSASKSRGWYAAILASFLFFGCFQAWEDEYVSRIGREDELRAANTETDQWKRKANTAITVAVIPPSRPNPSSSTMTPSIQIVAARRTLSDKQKDLLERRLAKISDKYHIHSIKFGVFSGDPEALAYARQFVALFYHSGTEASDWTLEGVTINSILEYDRFRFRSFSPPMADNPGLYLIVNRDDTTDGSKERRLAHSEIASAFSEAEVQDAGAAAVPLPVSDAAYNEIVLWVSKSRQ
jgi:hypothetical protein